ncbi:MAG: copper chaperone PCu(A)C [Anaerolineales bacterium]|nr:copper chaperone PCu(A)C [Anaerolineales bacterium]
MRRFAFVLTVFALAVAACAPAATPAPTAAPAGLQVVEAWARAAMMAPAAGAMATATPAAMMEATPAAEGMGMGMDGVNSAIYMTIQNPSATADRLIKAQSDAAQVVELHTMAEDNGVMRMRPVEAVDVPAQGEAVLKPGGFHVMLLGITRDLKVGDKVLVTLTFEKSAPLTVEAVVREN